MIWIVVASVLSFWLGARFGTQYATPRAFRSGMVAESFRKWTPGDIKKPPVIARVEGGLFSRQFTFTVQTKKEETDD